MKEIKTLLSLTLLVITALNSYAATHTWVDHAIGFWDDGANWDIGEPVGDSTAYIDNGTATVRNSGEVVYRGFYVGDGSGDDATVRIVSGDLTTGDSAQTTFFGDAGKGTLEISGGTYNLLVNMIMGDNASGEGVIDLNSGSFNTEWSIKVGNKGTGTITQTGGTFDGQIITLGEDDDSTGTYQISGGSLSCSSLKLSPHRFATSYPTFDIQSSDADITFTHEFSFYSPHSVFMAVPGSKIKMVGEYATFINEIDAANQLNVSGLGNLTMEFSDNSSPTEYCSYEVACEDVGATVDGYCYGNFTLDTLAVGGDTPTKVMLDDSYDNGNRNGGSECLYVRKLIVTAGSTLYLNGLNLYYQGAEIAGTVSGGTPQQINIVPDIDGSGTTDIADIRILAANWLSAGCTCPTNCNGADVNRDGRVSLPDLAMAAAEWLGGSGGAGVFWEETFDSDPGWGVEGEWAFGTPTGGGGSGVPAGYGNPDPTGGYTGSNVYGINLSGNYSPAVTGGYHYLTSPSINCTGRAGVEIRFFRWLNTDEPGYVPTNLEVSPEGTVWHEVWNSSDDTSSAITDAAWSQRVIDISAYADGMPTAQVRWGHQVNTGAYEYSGWNIDDVELWNNP